MTRQELHRNRAPVALPRPRRAGKVALILAMGLGLFAMAGSGFSRFFAVDQAARLRSSDPGSPISADVDASQSTTSAQRGELCRKLLTKGLKQLSSIEDYEATFYRQERVNGQLLEAESMHLKMRRSPRAVYLSWFQPNEGRELIWHRDAYDGKMLIHDCGWRGRVAQCIKVAPDNPLVMKYAARPIEELGLWALGEILDRNCGELSAPEVNVALSEKEIGDRPCLCFDITFAVAIPELNCTQAVIYLDKELNIPLGCELYQQAETKEEEPRLVAAYYYEELKINQGLSEDAFDPTNPDYHFGNLRNAKSEVSLDTVRRKES